MWAGLLPFERICAALAVVLALATAWPIVAQADEVVLPVPRAIIYGGQTIADSEVVEKTFAVSTNADGMASARSEIVGRVARRSLLPGQPVPLAWTKAADVVKQGIPARVILESGDLSISTIAMPLQSAAPGEPVSFQGPDGGVVLKGLAQEDGSIRLGAP